MKCTLPEPDRSGWDNRDYYDDVISELWEVLNLVEKMRAAQKDWEVEIANGCDEDWGKSFVKDNLEKEVDEWFNDLNNQQ